MNSDGMLGNIVNFALAFELLGIVLLYPYFLLNHVDSPLWSAVFHSVSAFCTAGFSIYGDNLVRFQTDWYVNIVISVLAVHVWGLIGVALGTICAMFYQTFWMANYISKNLNYLVKLAI